MVLGSGPGLGTAGTRCFALTQSNARWDVRTWKDTEGTCDAYGVVAPC